MKEDTSLCILFLEAFLIYALYISMQHTQNIHEGCGDADKDLHSLKDRWRYRQQWRNLPEDRVSETMWY